jgi:hypothetical protein
MTSPARHLSQAAELVRAFNHESISTGDGWQYAPHSYDAVGNLAYLVRMLSQAIEQATRPAMRTHEQGRLLIDGGGDPDQAVKHLRTALDTAVQAAGLLSAAVDHVHSTVAPMGLDTRGLPGFED